MKVVDKIRDINRLWLWFAVMMGCLMPITYIGWLFNFWLPQVYGLMILETAPLDVWKIKYWLAEMLVVASVGVASSAGYWLLADETKRAKLTMALLGVTVFYQWACGAFDWLWFGLHMLLGYPFPALNKLWYWNPYYWYLGVNWTTLHHIIYTVVLEAIILAVWVIWYFRVHVHEEAPIE